MLMPVSVAVSIFKTLSLESAAIAVGLPDSTVNGWTFASAGFDLTAVGTRSKQYTNCVYIGCSTHRVPSWSKVATRSAGGTNLTLDGSVVRWTNSTIACLAAPAFHEASGSFCAQARVLSARPKAAIIGRAQRKRI